MRHAITLLLSFLCLSATATDRHEPRAHDRLVRVILTIETAHHPGESPDGTSPIITGDTLDLQYVNTLLFLRAPCPLPIVGADHMHRAWMPLGAYRVGCWYPTIGNGLGGGYMFIDGEGDEYPSQFPWQAAPRAVFHPNDTVTITEPNYNGTTFVTEVMNRLQAQFFKDEDATQNEKP